MMANCRWIKITTLQHCPLQEEQENKHFMTTYMKSSLRKNAGRRRRKKNEALLISNLGHQILTYLTHSNYLTILRRSDKVSAAHSQTPLLLPPHRLSRPKGSETEICTLKTLSSTGFYFLRYFSLSLTALSPSTLVFYLLIAAKSVCTKTGPPFCLASQA